MKKVFQYLIVYISMFCLYAIASMIAQSVDFGGKFTTAFLFTGIATGLMVPIIITTKFASS